jgi:hypothetical protein
MHDQEGGVSIVGEAWSAARTTRSLPSRLLLPIVRSTCSGIRTSALIRGLQPLVHHRTMCEFSRRTRTLAHHLQSRRKRPAHARTSYALGAMRGWVRAPAAGLPRALAYAAPTSTATCAAARGQRKDRQVLGRVVPLDAAPSSLVVRKASTRRYLSFDPVTEQIASEMRLVLRTDKGKAGVVLPSFPRLAVRCLPPSPLRPFPNGVAWRGAPKLIRKPGAALLACSRLIRRTACP